MILYLATLCATDENFKIARDILVLARYKIANNNIVSFFFLNHDLVHAVW